MQMLGVAISKTFFRGGASPIKRGVIICQAKEGLTLWTGCSASAEHVRTPSEPPDRAAPWHRGSPPTFPLLQHVLRGLGEPCAVSWAVFVMEALRTAVTFPGRSERLSHSWVDVQMIKGVCNGL